MTLAAPKTAATADYSALLQLVENRLRSAVPDEEVPPTLLHCAMHQALFAGAVTLHTKIKARYQNIDANYKPITQRVETTPGRMLLSEILPRDPNVPFSLINRLLTKKDITNILDAVYRHCGQKETVIFADRLMQLGFSHACRAGISFGKDDLVIPAAKKKLGFRKRRP